MWWSCAGGSSVKGSGEVIRASAPYTSGWGSFVLLKNGLCQGSKGRQFEHVTPDICECQMGCMPGTFKVQLLSDTGFLLRKVMTSRPEMTWDEAQTVICLIQGDFLWCGISVSLAARQHLKKDAKHDLTATYNYRHIAGVFLGMYQAGTVRINISAGHANVSMED